MVRKLWEALFAGGIFMAVGYALLIVALGGCAQVEKYAGVIIPLIPTPQPTTSQTVAQPAAVARPPAHAGLSHEPTVARAMSAATVACESRLGKLCDTVDSGYPDACTELGLMCPVAGPNKNHVVKEQDELDRVMQQPMPADELTPPSGTPGKNVASDPWRPSYLDANVTRKPGSHLQWCGQRECTQVGRHALQEVVTDVYLPEALLYAETIPACSGILHFSDGALEVVTSRLGTNYMCKSVCAGPNGSWFINTFDRQYGFPFMALRKIAQCSTGNGATACATSPLMHAGLLQLLNLRIENGRCVPGNPDVAAFMAKPKPETYTSARALDGLIVPKALIPSMALDAEDMRLLHATHSAHKFGTLCKINHGLDALTDHDRESLKPWVTAFTCPPPQIVAYTGKLTGLSTAVHLQYESRCKLPGKGGETCHHARRLMDFSGKVAPEWEKTPDDKAILLLLEDVAGHGTWMAAQERIGLDPMAWCPIVGEDNNHRNAHVCAARGKRDLKIRPFRPDCQESCPVITCQQWIDQNRDLLKLLSFGSPPM